MLSNDFRCSYTGVLVYSHFIKGWTLRQPQEPVSQQEAALKTLIYFLH